MADELRVRRAAASDIHLISEIQRAAGKRFLGSGLIATPDGAPEDIPVQYFETALFERLLFVATLNSGPVGFALCSVERPDLYLEQISVTPASGRNGAGAALLEAVCSEASHRGLSGVTLSTFRDVPWNGPFYFKNGFAEVPRQGLALWQLDIERIQAATMDVNLRCFMRRSVRTEAAHAA